MSPLPEDVRNFQRDRHAFAVYQSRRVISDWAGSWNICAINRRSSVRHTAPLTWFHDQRKLKVAIGTVTPAPRRNCALLHKMDISRVFLAPHLSSASFKSAIQALRGERSTIKASTEARIKGSLHEGCEQIRPSYL
jgi:hypothetical protein